MYSDKYKTIKLTLHVSKNLENTSELTVISSKHIFKKATYLEHMLFTDKILRCMARQGLISQFLLPVLKPTLAMKIQSYAL